MEKLQAALKYQQMGLSIIPVKPDKKPYIEWAEFQQRRATADKIRGWWSKWPDANVGIITGAISGVDVIDIDSKQGEDKFLKTIVDELPSFNPPTARTPRGGKHLYIQATGNTNKAGFLQDVDYRGEGGYAVAPPSTNGSGKGYEWVQGASIFELEPAAAPACIINYNSLYIEGEVKKRLQVTSKTSSDFNFLTLGRRDDDLFNAANCLIKGGCEPAYTSYILDILAKNANPPFPEKEVVIKIQSALKRAGRKDRNIAQDVRDWVLTSTGFFLTSDCFTGLQLTSREEKKAATLALLRLCEGPEPVLERYGNRRGSYRVVEKDVEIVDFLNAPVDEFRINWPLGVGELCEIYPGNIIIVAGSKSAGKTAFLLNTVKMNMSKSDIIYLNSEMGDTEFRKRLELFNDVKLQDWKFKAFHRSSDFADLITNERKIYIIDFLEVTEDFWKVARFIQEIHKKLKDGVCIIAIQKSEGKETGRGGDFSKEKARLYLNLDYFPVEGVNKIKIADAKAWRTDRNPRGLCREYKLIHGSVFKADTDWQ